MTALVVGNPDLGAELNLPWAEREARMVGQQEREATVLVRGDATEVKVKKLLDGAGIIHFATHGDLSESDPLSSALLLVGGEGEDGRLEVREVFGLDLHARLVVLSACETGLGKLSRGDEVVGLQRAFLYAGTPPSSPRCGRLTTRRPSSWSARSIRGWRAKGRWKPCGRPNSRRCATSRTRMPGPRST